ncbi:MAG TPA: HAMP domain-containing sensor histidine kinase [Gaiellaceae bacterium]|nr:HAMP domain-containing sensor histidine kinase [Gaiellaceae bacterium]
MSTLRRRLFVAVLAAIVVAVACTVAIGAGLARRTADHNLRVSLAQQANLLATEEQQPSYVPEDYVVGDVRVIARRRAEMKQFVPTGKPSNGTLTLEGVKDIYSYRPIGPRGLLMLTPASRPPAWGSFLRDLLLAGGVGAVLAGLISYLLARSIATPIGRVAQASRALAEGSSPEPLPTKGTVELVSLAQAFNDMARQLAASRESEQNFLLSVSHELKTPLTAIRGYAEGLAEGAFPADVAAETILVESRRLERLVRDLLDLARMNRHAFQVSREPVDLAEVARDVVARHQASANEYGVILAAGGDESWVEADHDRVLQIGSNLVENAMRVTPRAGYVTIRADGSRLIVQDTGPGLDPADVPHAFDRFYLYDKHSRERRVGSGLGLAIVKQLTLAMGGEVAVETAPGEGATFIVTLPSGSKPGRVDDLEVAPVHAT